MVMTEGLEHGLTKAVKSRGAMLLEVQVAWSLIDVTCKIETIQLMHDAQDS